MCTTLDLVRHKMLNKYKFCALKHMDYKHTPFFK